MKKLIKLIRRWRYRRIFKYWYCYYLKAGHSPSAAFEKANIVFFWRACFQQYDQWYAREYLGIELNRSKNDSSPKPCQADHTPGLASHPHPENHS